MVVFEPCSCFASSHEFENAWLTLFSSGKSTQSTHLGVCVSDPSATIAVTMSRSVAFIDIETTSLLGECPDTLLLEVALLVTDLDLVPVGSVAAVVSWTPEQLRTAHWDAKAREMHEGNGLLEAVVGPDALPLKTIEERLLCCLGSCAGVDLSQPPDHPGAGSELPTAPIWAGCSPGLDRDVLRRVMPRFYSYVHYRTLDSTSLKLALEWWAGENTFRAERPHRAGPDAEAARNLAERARAALTRLRSPVDVTLLSA